MRTLFLCPISLAQSPWILHLAAPIPSLPGNEQTCVLLSLPTSAKQLPKPRPTRAGWHSHENQGRAAPACAAQPLELAAEPCQAERSRARGAQRERSAEQEHSPASPGPAQPDRDLARLKPSPSLRPSENLLLPAGLFPAIYGAGLTRCPCERPSPGKQLPRACSPNRGASPGAAALSHGAHPDQTHSSTCGRGLHTAGAPPGDAAPFFCAPARTPSPPANLRSSSPGCSPLQRFSGSWPRNISHPEHLHGVRQAHGDSHRALSSDPSCGAGRLDMSRAERLSPRESRARGLGEAGD